MHCSGIVLFRTLHVVPCIWNTAYYALLFFWPEAQVVRELSCAAQSSPARRFRQEQLDCILKVEGSTAPVVPGSG